MKSIWLFILMIGGVAQLKAQQLATPLSDKKPDNSVYLYFKNYADGSILKSTPVAPNLPQASPVVPTVKDVIVAEMNDHMPVVKLQSTDKMPIVKTDEPNMRYTMLIKPLGEAKPDLAIKNCPALIISWLKILVQYFFQLSKADIHFNPALFGVG